MTKLRDALTLGLGTVLLGSQVVGYFQDREVSLILASAGVSLLAGYPLLKVGDRREDER